VHEWALTDKDCAWNTALGADSKTILLRFGIDSGLHSKNEA